VRLVRGILATVVGSCSALPRAVRGRAAGTTAIAEICPLSIAMKSASRSSKLSAVTNAHERTRRQDVAMGRPSDAAPWSTLRDRPRWRHRAFALGTTCRILDCWRDELGDGQPVPWRWPRRLISLKRLVTTSTTLVGEIRGVKRHLVGGWAPTQWRPTSVCRRRQSRSASLLDEGNHPTLGRKDARPRLVRGRASRLRGTATVAGRPRRHRPGAASQAISLVGGPLLVAQWARCRIRPVVHLGACAPGLRRPYTSDR